jgi:hypothetical protein
MAARKVVHVVPSSEGWKLTGGGGSGSHDSKQEAV